MSQPNWTIRFEGYLPVDDRMEERLRRVCAEIDKLPASALHIDEAAHLITIDYTQVKGLIEASREIVRTTRVGEHIVVKPPWDECEAQSGDIILEIDPGTAFGSGLHESTRLCLRALEKHLTPGVTAVDFGTGSGILAIAAAKLGAACVTAIEADESSVETARANVTRNGLEGTIEVHHALSPAFIGSPVDLVIANITAETITAHLDAIAEALNTGGLLIASGMTISNVPGVEESLPDAGFSMVEKLTDGQWVALMAKKQ
jgi:ribosomal protein L11 methyltransferase